MRSNLVQRQHLVDRLREGRGRRLTLVCAPAGYGKTTLLGQWYVEDRDRVPFAWLSLDRDDADPVRLWNQIVFGLHGIHPPAGTGSSKVLAAGPPGIVSAAIPLLVNELVDAPPLVLVLEDWHVIRNPLCDETLRAFVEHAPESVQVVVSSRSDPGLPLARLRAHDDLLELRAEQLRLSPHESAELFRHGGVELETDDVRRLTSRTEGWAAGLHLAAIALREQHDTRAYVEAFSGDTRHVLDYLARDVFDAVSPEIREFMIRTSILERLSAELCDWVLETADAAEMLAEIEHANLFLVSLDEAGDVYRYHQLFARMLQRELALVHPEAFRELHARASLWFETAGDVESAVAHAIASRDVTRAGALVGFHAREYWSSGRIATVARWLETLTWPDAMSDPELAVTRAAVLGLTGSPADLLEEWVQVASADLDRRSLANGLHSIESGIALLRSLYLTKGLEPGLASARRAVELERPGSVWRRQALLALGQALYLLGGGEEARVPLEEARRLPDATGQAPGVSVVLAYLAFLEVDLDRAASAERLARDALSMLEERHIAVSPAAANAELALGVALMASTDGHGAIDHIERAEALSAPLRPSYWHVHALLKLAEARHRVGRSAEATEALERARSELDTLPDAGMLGVLLAELDERLQARHRREGFLGEALSESELRVLRRLVDGQSLREVAKELFLSLNTVKTHRRTIYRKLGATTREEALERAAELGIAASEPSESPG